jgi:hypothetical protein
MSGFFPIAGFGVGAPPILVILLLLDLVLKGFALWRAGRNNQLYWFIALLVVNSAGILPAIYLLAFSKKGKK